MNRLLALLSRIKPRKEKKFSFLLFSVCAPLQLFLLFLVYRMINTSLVWSEFSNSSLVLLSAFAGHSVNNSLVEYLFHRYILHTAPFMWLARFAKQHRKHHGLTHIVRLDPEESGDPVPVRNRYPIVQSHQHEASFFPYYGLSLFFLVFTPPLWLLKFLLPALPILSTGYLAVFWSYSFYEVWHAIEHLDYERFWRPKVESHRYGWLWMKIYGFHLEHHANPKRNEAISGFLFGLPLWDWIFGTYKPTRRLLLDGALADVDDFSAPTPRWPVFALDRFFEKREAVLIKKRQARARQSLAA